MQIAHFDWLMRGLRRLTQPQLHELMGEVGKQDELEDFKALAWQRHEADATCPHCDSDQLYGWGTTASGQCRMRCRACLKTFTPLTGTGFERLRDKARLVENAACMAQCLSVRETAERLQVNPKTAYLLRKRFMPELAKHQPGMLAGVLEGDETFFRKSYKGQRSGVPRESYSRGTPAKKRGINDEHVAVLTVISRGSPECLISILPGVPNTTSVNEALSDNIAPGSVLYTDGSKVYAKVESMQDVKVFSVLATVHVQNINALHSRMKCWMRNFKGVATKNLGLYLAVFRFFDRDASRKAWSGFLVDSFGVPYFNT